ncbi:MAG: thioesterase family protein [Phycisphaerales bacterium]
MGAESTAVQLRVRYCECDPMGVVHHAAYAPWLEIARTELLRGLGKSYAELESEGVLMVVVKLEVAYRRPVRYDDVVEVSCGVRGGGRVKIEHEYGVRVVAQSAHGPAGEVRTGHVCAVARTVLACVDRAGRVRELPGWLVGGG